MPTFFYRATNVLGRIKTGVVDAYDSDDAAETLASLNYTVEEVRLVDADAVAAILESTALEEEAEARAKEERTRALQVEHRDPLSETVESMLREGRMPALPEEAKPPIPKREESGKPAGQVPQESARHSTEDVIIDRLVTLILFLRDSVVIGSLVLLFYWALFLEIPDMERPTTQKKHVVLKNYDITIRGRVAFEGGPPLDENGRINGLKFHFFFPDGRYETIKDGEDILTDGRGSFEATFSFKSPRKPRNFYLIVKKKGYGNKGLPNVRLGKAVEYEFPEPVQMKKFNDFSPSDESEES
jgi:hypothetical protein